MAEPSIIQVVDSGPGYTTVLASDGNTYTLKGVAGWRNNNPGNLRPGSLTNGLGAIGVADTGSNGKFLVFPDVATGRQAQEVLQFQTPYYAEKTIKQALKKYAPAGDNNNPTAYAATLANAIGVSVDTKLKDLTPSQRRAYLKAQHGVEDNRPGKILGAEGSPVPAAIRAKFGGVALPPASIPDSPAQQAGVALASYGASRVPLPAPAPLTPESMGPQFDLRPPNLPLNAPIPQGRSSYYGNQTANWAPRVGNLGMPPIPSTPPALAGVPAAGRALSPLTAGAGMAGGAAPAALLQGGAGLARGAVPSLPGSPMPGRPVALQTGPQAPAVPPAIPRTASFVGSDGRTYTQVGFDPNLGGGVPIYTRGAAPSEPSAMQRQAQPQQQLVRLASGKMIPVGIQQGSNGPVQIADDGRGNAVITKIRNPGAIPGVIDPIKEASSPTLAGAFIRAKIPEVMGDALQGAQQNLGYAGDAIKSNAVQAVNNIGQGAQNVAGTIGNAFGSLGSLFGGPPSVPKSWSPWGNSVMRQPSGGVPPIPQSRPMFAPQQQAAAFAPSRSTGQAGGGTIYDNPGKYGSTQAERQAAAAQRAAFLAQWGG